MSATLSFPGLGLEFDLNPIVFSITDSWTIKWYGIIITAGCMLAVCYVLRRAKTFGLDPDRVLDVGFGGILGGIVGARLYYVFFSDWATYRANPWSILQIWKGGIAIYGALIGGVLVGLILCRWRKVKILPMLDLGAAAVILGQAIGRWGNFVNIEAFGGNTTAPWGMYSSSISLYLQSRQAELAKIGVIVDPSMPVHPTFFYESMWCLAGFVFLVWYTKRRRYDGELALIYCGWYGLGRFWIEGLRTDSLMLGSVRVSQALALICVVASAAVMLVIRARMKASAGPNNQMLYVNTEEGKAIVAGTFYTGEYTAQKATPVCEDAALSEPRPQIRNLRGSKKMAAIRLVHRRAGVRKRGFNR